MPCVSKMCVPGVLTYILYARQLLQLNGLTKHGQNVSIFKFITMIKAKILSDRK